MKNRYLTLVKRIGKNITIIAIIMIPSETILNMLKKNSDFVNKIISLTEKKVRKMIERANSGSGEINIQESIKLISSKEFRSLSIKPFS
jgi:hypothetical protein